MIDENLPYLWVKTVLSRWFFNDASLNILVGIKEFIRMMNSSSLNRDRI